MVAAAIVDSAQEPQETLVNQKPQETPVKAAEAGSSVKAVDADHAESGLPVEASRGEAAATSSAASANTHSHWLKDIQKNRQKATSRCHLQKEGAHRRECRLQGSADWTAECHECWARPLVVARDWPLVVAWAWHLVVVAWVWPW